MLAIPGVSRKIFQCGVGLIKFSFEKTDIALQDIDTPWLETPRRSAGNQDIRAKYAIFLRHSHFFENINRGLPQVLFSHPDRIFFF